MKKKIKIYESKDKKGEPVPQIRLQGKWLENIGFKIGSIMEVEYESKKIVLTTKTDSNEK